MYTIYWIRDENHNDPLKEGYIGITSRRISERLEEHKQSQNNNLRRALDNGAVIEELAILLSKEDAKTLEKFLRPRKNIGWNIAQGGGTPPFQKGENFKTKKNGLRGTNRTSSQKRSSYEHSKRLKNRVAHNRRPIIIKNQKYESYSKAKRQLGLSTSAFNTAISNLEFFESFEKIEQFKEHLRQEKISKICKARSKDGWKGTHGYRWYTNGDEVIRIKVGDPIPSGFYWGRTPKKPPHPIGSGNWGPKEQIKCPHCAKVGGKPTMRRWHFNNCRNLKNGG